MKRWRTGVYLGLASLLGWAPQVLAQANPSFNSTHFQVIESDLGASGDLNGSSSGPNGYNFAPTSDDGGSTLGDFAVGNSNSATLQTNSGFNTTAQPSLTLVVNTSTVSLGVLSTAAKSTATATFSVIDYTSYGYVVQVIGNPPTIGGHTLSALTTDTASSAGTEQFGVNLVLNSVSSVGADPVQVPSGSPVFGYGVAGDGATNNYKQSEKWRYNSGETVASSPKSSGQTNYTMTFMANTSTTTPAGAYTGAISIVATGTY